MLHVACFFLLVGQLPPPPAPNLPEKQSPPANDPEAQRKWLLDHLTADLRAQGRLDTQKQHEIERTVNNVRDSHLGKSIEHYQQHKAEVEAQAKAALRRQEAYRESLNRELQWRIVMSRQEQAQGDLRYSPSFATQAATQDLYAPQQGQGVVQNFYVVQSLPDPVFWLPYYAPFHHHHHRR